VCRGLWRSLKYEEIYLHAYATVAEAKAGIGAWLDFYNTERQHQSLSYRTPQQIYQESAQPPIKHLILKGFDIDEVNGRLIHPAVAPTAIGADIETGRVTP
jgi:hypothetical protein